MNIVQTIIQIERTALNLDRLSVQDLVQKALGIDSDAFQKIKSLKGKGQKIVCCASIPKNNQYYKCFDCCQQSSHIYCQACYKPEKHINHVVTYHYAYGGFCDCGDILIMKKESFCDMHQANNMADQNPELILGETICNQYRNFLQVAFSLLINKIEQSIQYPPMFLERITVAYRQLNDVYITNLVQEQTKQLAKYPSLINEISRIYKLIFYILQEIIPDNITISLLTSKYLQQPIDKIIQSLIQLHHIHEPDTFKQTQISPEQQMCHCKILELYVKFNVFLCQVIPLEIKDISSLLYDLYVDETFKSYLCRLILKYFHLFYKPIHKYKFVTKNNSKFKIIANQFSYSENNSITELIKAIQQSQQIQKIMCKQDVLSAGIFICFHQFEVLFQQELLKLYKETNSNQCFHVFKIFSERMVQIPLCNEKSRMFCFNFINVTLSKFSTIIIKNCLIQIEELLGLENKQFQFLPTSLQSKTCQKLQDDSLLIYVLTRVYPCSVTEAKTFSFLQPKVKKQFENNQYIAIHVVASYRKLLANLVEACRQYYNKNQMGLLNILRIVIHYFIHNFINSFEIQSQDLLITLLSNQIISDRNFIVILSIYLSYFNESQDAYKDLITISGDNPFLLKQVMHFVLKRTLLNYIIFQYEGNNQLYKGQFKYYKENAKLSEVALEQVDIAYVQMYAFIFREEGLNEIIDQFQIIGNLLNRPTDPLFLICRISQSDYDYFQCLGNISVPEQILKGLTNLFQTIFYAQTFYTPKDIITLLKQLSYDSSIDLQKIILSFCELNQDNEQLQLKKTLLPPQYEPVFVQQIQSLKDKIDEKLKTQNDQFTQLFGSSLATELKQLNTPKSTVTNKRKVILQAIVNDQKQLLLENLKFQIQDFYEKGDLRNIVRLLENSSIYLNLLFQSNKYFGNNPKIVNCLKTIKQIIFQIISDGNLTHTTDSVYSNYVLLLDEQAIIQTQQLKDYAHRAQKSEQKKQQLQQRFNQMSNEFIKQMKNDNDPPIILDQTCSLCSITFGEGQVQYKAAFLQFTNFHNFEQQVPLQRNQLVDILSIHGTCCGHLFHSQCVKKNTARYTFGESSYLTCPSCFQPYNFPLMNPRNIIKLQNGEFLENIGFFFSTLPKNIVEKYAKFTTDDGFKIEELVDEIFSCVLCNLLLQLLGDIKTFFLKEYHIFLQDVIQILRLKYQDNKQNVIDTLNLDMSQILFKLLKAIQQTLIAKDSIVEFQQELQFLFQYNKEAIFEMITQKELKSQVNVLIYDFNQFKARLREKYIGFFTLNFRQFLITYNLAPCQKKECRSLPLLRYDDQEQQQYICLICLKKMCSQTCGRKPSKPKQSMGNLMRHAMKKHENRTMYLQISSSKILIMVVPFITCCNLTLFQNLIGEQPELGCYESVQYENFKLNLKAVDLIVDILSGEIHVPKMLADKKKVFRKNL